MGRVSWKKLEHPFDFQKGQKPQWNAETQTRQGLLEWGCLIMQGYSLQIKAHTPTKQTKYKHNVFQGDFQVGKEVLFKGSLVH